MSEPAHRWVNDAFADGWVRSVQVEVDIHKFDLVAESLEGRLYVALGKPVLPWHDPNRALPQTASFLLR